MILQILLLIVGLALVVFGADYLVDGASSIARRFGLSEFVIGLTIVGMGTSAPEMVVSFIGALQGNAAISLGNVVGSNIFNTLLILGTTALILPIGITRENMRKDIPINVLVTIFFILMLSSGLSRWEGAVLLAFFAWYMWDSFHSGTQDVEQPADGSTPRKVWLSLLMIAGGLSALVFGGRLFVNSATHIAQALGVSDKFIAITILAGGTSLPELATCVAAAVKKKGQLALGNIIGSNIFNVLLILGGSALIHPLAATGISYVDMAALLVSALALVAACFIGKKNQLDRLDGALFLVLFAAYMTYLIINL